MPVISNAGDHKNRAAVTRAAIALGRLGGKAGTGAAKRRSAAHHAKMVAAKKERRDCALEVLGALIECEHKLRMINPCVESGDWLYWNMIETQTRARLAIERALGKPVEVKT